MRAAAVAFLVAARNPVLCVVGEELTRQRVYPRHMQLFLTPQECGDDLAASPPSSKLVDYLQTQFWWKDTKECETWAVVSTARAQPTPAIKVLAQLTDWCLIVVAAGADTVSEAEYGLERGIYLSIAAQRRMAAVSPFVAMLPWRGFARRNLGYLVAILCGAEAVWDFQDDCRIKAPASSLLRQQGSPFSPYDAASHPGSLKALTLCNPDENGPVYNPYLAMQSSSWPSWPRGLPPEKFKNGGIGARKQLCRDPSQTGSNLRSGVGVLQFLVDGEPDTDAIYQLALPFPLTFEGLAGDADLLVMPKRVLAPYNSQATLHFRDALYGLLLPTTATGRIADIWRGYFMQPQLWAAGRQLAFAGPQVARDLNDLLNTTTTVEDGALARKHLLAEEAMHRSSGPLTALLTTWASDRPSAAGWMEDMWADMYSYGLIDAADVRLAQLWLGELAAGGYRFPCLREAVAAPPTATGQPLSPGGDAAQPPDSSSGSGAAAGASLGAGWIEPLVASPPLRGWWMSGGVSRVVSLDPSARTGMPAAEETGNPVRRFGRQRGNPLSQRQLADTPELLSREPNGPEALSALCSRLCVDDMHCSAWSLQVVRGKEAAGPQDVPCGDGGARRCRCVQLSAEMPPKRAPHPYDRDRNPRRPVEPIEASGVVKSELEEWELTRSGVVQRNVRVYRGAGPPSPRYLYILSFNQPVRTGVASFLLQKLLPLCLPSGVDVVIAAPFSPGVDGILAVPWMLGWFNAGLVPALAYWRFPWYDGYYLGNDDYMLDLWRFDSVGEILGTSAWGNFKNRAEAVETVTAKRSLDSPGWWYDYINGQDNTILNATDEALRELRATPRYSALIKPGSLLASSAHDAFITSGGSTDGYYIPKRMIGDYAVLAGLMAEHGVFLEISTPTIMAMLATAGEDTTDYKMILGHCNLMYEEEDDDQRDIAKLWSAECPSIHPVKLSRELNREIAVDMFTKHCAAYRLHEPLRPLVFP